MKKYAKAVCGGIDNVKRMYVAELRRKRIEKKLVPEELDALLGLGSEFPTIRELEENPLLFTADFHQKFQILRIDGPPDDFNKLFDLTGEEIWANIRKYLKNRVHLEKALKGFRTNARVVHLSGDQKRIEQDIEKYCRGERIESVPLNTVPPLEYATVYIHSCIFSELSADEKSRFRRLTDFLRALRKFLFGCY